MLLLGILFRLRLPPSCSTCGSGRIAAMAMGCENNLKLSCEIVQLGAGSILRSQRMEELSSLRSWVGPVPTFSNSIGRRDLGRVRESNNYLVTNIWQ